MKPRSTWETVHIIMYARERDSDAGRGGWGMGRGEHIGNKAPSPLAFDLLGPARLARCLTFFSN